MSNHIYTWCMWNGTHCWVLWPSWVKTFGGRGRGRKMKKKSRPTWATEWNLFSKIKEKTKHISKAMTGAVDSVLECFFFFCFFHMQVLHYLIMNMRLSISPYLPSFASHVILILSEFLNHNLCSFSSVEKSLFFFLIILWILILYLLHILQIHFPVWHLIMCCPITINFDLSNLPNISWFMLFF